MAMLGVPYGEAVKGDVAIEMARAQALEVANQIREQSLGAPLVDDLEDKKVVALIAYIQRLGTDLFAAPVEVEVDVESTGE